MRQQLLPLLASAAPLLVYYATEAVLGKEPALVLTLAWILGEIGFYLWRRWPLTPIFLYASMLTLAFGAEDLWVEHNHGQWIEPALTAALTAAACAAGAALLPAFLREALAQASRRRGHQQPAGPGPRRVRQLRLGLVALALVFVGRALFLARATGRFG